MDFLKKIDLKREELNIGMDEFIATLGFKNIAEYDDVIKNNTLSFEQLEEIFSMFEQRKHALAIAPFDILEVIDTRRKSEKVSNGVLAKAIGVSETVFANRYSRKSFSFDEIMKLCDVLNIDLNDLKKRVSIESEDIYNMLRGISYCGMNNYSQNAWALEKIKELLRNSLIVADVSKDVLFEFGFWTLNDAPNHNNYGIREAQSYLNSILDGSDKINIDFMVGIVCCGFMGSSSGGKNYFEPKILLYRILEHIFATYDSDELIYIFDLLRIKLDMKKSMNIFMVREAIVPFIEDKENYYGRDEEGMKIILQYLLKKVSDLETSPLLQYSVKDFVMKLQYLFNASSNGQLNLI